MQKTLELIELSCDPTLSTAELEWWARVWREADAPATLNSPAGTGAKPEMESPDSARNSQHDTAAGREG